MRSGPEGQRLTFRPFFCAAMLAVFVASFAGCGAPSGDAQQNLADQNTDPGGAATAETTPGTAAASTGKDAESRETTMSIEDANQSLANELMPVSGISAVGISECDGTPCLKVYVVELTEELDERIPLEFQGHEVVVDESGEIRARRKKN